jgi:hypothetical protein
VHGQLLVKKPPTRANLLDEIIAVGERPRLCFALSGASLAK